MKVGRSVGMGCGFSLQPVLWGYCPVMRLQRAGTQTGEAV